MSYVVKTKDGNPIEIEGRQLLGSDHIDAEIKDFSDTERSFLAVASVESPDRMGDVISVKGWELDNYLKNPVVMPFHQYSTLPVGRSLSIFIKGKKLMFVPQFAPYQEASRMYEMYRDKYLKGFSVGFIPKESKKIETEEEDRPLFWHQPTKYLKQELLEVSVAPIPAHQDALSELKAMVKKGDIYVPPKYLMDKNEPYVESFDEYIHVVVESEDKFKRLYIIPLHVTKDGIAEEAYAWAVFGPTKGGDHDLYFNQCFIFPKDENSTEEKLLKWVEDNSNNVDINTDSKDSPIILSLFDKNTEIKLEPFDPRKYESKSSVLVELPRLEKESAEDVETEWDDIEGEDITPEEMEIDADTEAEEKPFPNEHACRLNSPGKYTRFRRTNCGQKSDGKCIDVIFGRKKDGKSEIQSLRYKTKVWSASDASTHCKGREGIFEAAKGKKEDDRTRRYEEALARLNEFKLTDEENAKLVKELSKLTEEQLVERLDKSFKEALKISFDLLIKAFEDAFKKHRTELVEKNEVAEEVIDIDSIENEPVPGKNVIELEDGIKTQTPNEKNIDLGVSDEEFTDIVKAAINACLGRLEDE